MTRKETVLATIVGMAVLTTVMTTSINYVTPASALGQVDMPMGLAGFSGLPAIDKPSDFGGFLDKDQKSGYNTLLDGTGGTSSGLPGGERENSLLSGLPVSDMAGGMDGMDGAAARGLPSDEMNAASAPQQDGGDAGGNDTAEREDSEDSEDSEE